MSAVVGEERGEGSSSFAAKDDVRDGRDGRDGREDARNAYLKYASLAPDEAVMRLAEEETRVLQAVAGEAVRRERERERTEREKKEKERREKEGQ